MASPHDTSRAPRRRPLDYDEQEDRNAVELPDRWAREWCDDLWTAVIIAVVVGLFIFVP